MEKIQEGGGFKWIRFKREWVLRGDDSRGFKWRRFKRFQVDKIQEVSV